MKKIKLAFDQKRFTEAKQTALITKTVLEDIHTALQAVEKSNLPGLKGKITRRGIIQDSLNVIEHGNAQQFLVNIITKGHEVYFFGGLPVQSNQLPNMIAWPHEVGQLQKLIDDFNDRVRYTVYYDITINAIQEVEGSLIIPDDYFNQLQEQFTTYADTPDQIELYNQLEALTEILNKVGEKRKIHNLLSRIEITENKAHFDKLLVKQL